MLYRFAVPLLAGFALAVSGCGGATPSAGPPQAASQSPSSSDAPEPSPTSEKPRTLTMAFGGDIHFEGFVRPLVDDPNSLRELRSTLGKADISVVNLETAITEGGTPLTKTYTFRAPERVLPILERAGVDVIAMANNHAVDFGLEGFADTMAAKKRSPVPVIGIGEDADEAFEPASLEVKGVKVAVLNGTQVLEETLTYHSAGPDKPGVANALDSKRIVAATREAAKSHDVVVVFLHWGIEPNDCPDAGSIALADELEAAGADIIAGGHTHRINGSGWVGDAYVAYGLGNFVFYRADEPSARSGVLTLTLKVPAEREPRSGSPLVRSAKWTPMLINSDGVPRVPDQATQDRLHTIWEQARACTPARATPDAS